MRWAGMLLLTLLWTVDASAQDDLFDFPVSIFTGHVRNPYYPQEAEERTAIRKLGIKRVAASWQKDDGTYDTLRSYLEAYTSQGDRIPLDQERGDFGGVNRIEYDAKGRMIAKLWRYDNIEGCGTGGHFRVVADHRTTYAYKDGLLILESNGSIRPFATLDSVNSGKPSSFTAHRYDKRGRRTATIRYWISPPANGDTLADRDCHCYKYDMKGRLLQTFIVDGESLLHEGSPAAHKLDSLLQLAPAGFGDILLRQSYEWRDTVLAQKCGPNADALSEEAEEAMDAAIELRDSLDEEASRFYESTTKSSRDILGFIGNNYNGKGLLTGRTHFTEDDLTRKDTFIYNASGQLVRWDGWHLDNDRDFQPWEIDMLSFEPTHRIWDFEYNGEGRVSACIHSKWFTGYGDSGKFKPDYVIRYAFSYNGDGTAMTMQREKQKNNYGFNPAEIPPISTYANSYFIRYERY